MAQSLKKFLMTAMTGAAVLSSTFAAGNNEKAPSKEPLSGQKVLPPVSNSTRIVYQRFEAMKAKTDTQVVDILFEHLKKHEGLMTHVYCDVTGAPHIGYGKKISDVNTFMAMPLRDQKGRLLSKEEKKSAFNRITQKVAQMARLKRANYNPFNRNARTYAGMFPYTMTKTDAEAVLKAEIRHNIPKVKAAVEKNGVIYYNAPVEMQAVFGDIYFNTGNIKGNKWPTFYEKFSALRQNPADKALWGAVAENTEREKVGKERDDDTKALVLAGKERGFSTLGTNLAKMEKALYPSKQVTLAARY